MLSLHITSYHTKCNLNTFLQISPDRQKRHRASLQRLAQTVSPPAQLGKCRPSIPGKLSSFVLVNVLNLVPHHAWQNGAGGAFFVAGGAVPAQPQSCTFRSYTMYH